MFQLLSSGFKVPALSRLVYDAWLYDSCEPAVQCGRLLRSIFIIIYTCVKFMKIAGLLAGQ